MTSFAQSAGYARSNFTGENIEDVLFAQVPGPAACTAAVQIDHRYVPCLRPSRRQVQFRPIGCATDLQ